MPLSILFGFLSFPSLILLIGWDPLHHPEGVLVNLALAGLGISCFARDGVRLGAPGRLRGLLLGPMVVLWLSFYAADLHEARFGWTLLLALGGAAIGALHDGFSRFSRGSQPGLPVASILGALVGLGVVWALMVPRADNGCTGVSGSYQLTLALHPALGIWLAPWVCGRDAPPRDRS